MGEEGIRIGLLAHWLEVTSGESRQIVNFARGFQAGGARPAIFALAATPGIRRLCATRGLELHAVQDTLTKIEMAQVMGYGSRLAQRLRKLVMTGPPCDMYIVVQDAALSIAATGLPSPVVQYCCGDLSLLLLDKGFRSARGIAADAYALGFTSQIERHAAWAGMCYRRVANSRFTASLVSYLYNLSFHAVVYPPVDTGFFCPRGDTRSSGPYALAVLRGRAEPSYEVVQKLAQSTPVIVVGGAAVRGAQNVGRVSDEELARLYSGATVTLSPSMREFFGYPIVESMACGTPAIAFAQGGPTEIISSERNGWLCQNEEEFVKLASDLVKSGVSDGVRKQALRDAQAYSIQASCSQILRLLRA